jgi:hypothetical protein
MCFRYKKANKQMQDKKIMHKPKVKRCKPKIKDANRKLNMQCKTENKRK